MEIEVIRKEGGTKDLGLCLEIFLFISKFWRNLILNSIKFVFSMIFGLLGGRLSGFSIKYGSGHCFKNSCIGIVALFDKGNIN